MRMSNFPRALRMTCAAVMLCAVAGGARAQQTIAFDEQTWNFRNAATLEYGGRTCLEGMASLENVEFGDGVIEVDVIFPKDNARSYPGINFRIQSERNYERFYIRPHRGSLYPDVLQYTPVVNGVAGWQLYSGDGYTAMADIPIDEWIHVRMEIKGSQGRVFFGGSERPALVIDRLEHGTSRGAIGLMGPRDGTAYFSNFSYTAGGDLSFLPPPPLETPPGMMTGWELSQPIKFTQIALDAYPDPALLGSAAWQQIEAAPPGLVDVARYVQRTGGIECVLAKRTIHADQARMMELQFGYSDIVSVFLNGRLLYTGASAYQQRDPSFLGIVGLFDALYLPLDAGDNELMLLVAESFGGWGFMCREGNVSFERAGMTRRWLTGDDFLVPETVLYDPADRVLYVSNYDAYRAGNPVDRQFITRMKLDGTIDSLKWVAGLVNPTGMCLAHGKLYVVERRTLTEIDRASGTVVNRFNYPQAGFPNDIAPASDGSLYISDSNANAIYRFADGSFEIWLSGDEIRNPNGLQIHGNSLIVGNNGDRSLKTVDIATKEISTIATLPTGVIDGIETDRDGNFLVSQAVGRLYRITPEGSITTLLDTTGLERGTANFAYVAEENLLVIPTFTDNRVVAYELAP